MKARRSPPIPFGARVAFALMAFLAATSWAFALGDPLSTGRVMTRREVSALFPNRTLLRADRYAVVNSACLPGLQEQFVANLFHNGLKPEWQPRFDCNKFALTFVATARMRYRASHAGEAVVPPLAIGETWFMTGPASAHAVVFAVTERGVVYWDPQSGREISLKPREVKGTFMRRM